VILVYVSALFLYQLLMCWRNFVVVIFLVLRCTDFVGDAVCYNGK